MKYKFLKNRVAVQLEVTVADFLFLRFLCEDYNNTIDEAGAEECGLNADQVLLMKNLTADFIEAEFALQELMKKFVKKFDKTKRIMQ